MCGLHLQLFSDPVDPVEGFFLIMKWRARLIKAQDVGFILNSSIYLLYHPQKLRKTEDLTMVHNMKITHFFSLLNAILRRLFGSENLIVKKQLFPCHWVDCIISTKPGVDEFNRWWNERCVDQFAHYSNEQWFLRSLVNLMNDALLLSFVSRMKNALIRSLVTQMIGNKQP